MKQDLFTVIICFPELDILPLLFASSFIKTKKQLYTFSIANTVIAFMHYYCMEMTEHLFPEDLQLSVGWHGSGHMENNVMQGHP